MGFRKALVVGIKVSVEADFFMPPNLWRETAGTCCMDVEFCMKASESAGASMKEAKLYWEVPIDVV